jgi:hypothetical protein
MSPTGTIRQLARGTRGRSARQPWPTALPIGGSSLGRQRTTYQSGAIDHLGRARAAHFPIDGKGATGTTACVRLQIGEDVEH